MNPVSIMRNESRSEQLEWHICSVMSCFVYHPIIFSILSSSVLRRLVSVFDTVQLKMDGGPHLARGP